MVKAMAKKMELNVVFNNITIQVLCSLKWKAWERNTHTIANRVKKPDILKQKEKQNSCYIEIAGQHNNANGAKPMIQL